MGFQSRSSLVVVYRLTKYGWILIFDDDTRKISLSYHGWDEDESMFSTFKIDPYAYDQYDFASLNHSDKRNLMSINYYMQLDIKSIVHPSIKSLPSFHVHRTFIICPLFLSQKLFRFFCINQTDRRPTSSSFSKTFVYIC